MPRRTSIPNDEAAAEDLRSGCIANIEAVLDDPHLRCGEQNRERLRLAINWAEAVENYILAHAE